MRYLLFKMQYLFDSLFHKINTVDIAIHNVFQAVELIVGECLALVQNGGSVVIGLVFEQKAVATAAKNPAKLDQSRYGNPYNPALGIGDVLIADIKPFR